MVGTKFELFEQPVVGNTFLLTMEDIVIKSVGPPSTAEFYPLSPYILSTFHVHYDDEC